MHLAMNATSVIQAEQHWVICRICQYTFVRMTVLVTVMLHVFQVQLTILPVEVAEVCTLHLFQ